MPWLSATLSPPPKEQWQQERAKPRRGLCGCCGAVLQDAAGFRMLWDAGHCGMHDVVQCEMLQDAWGTSHGIHQPLSFLSPLHTSSSTSNSRLSSSHWVPRIRTDEGLPCRALTAAPAWVWEPKEVLGSLEPHNSWDEWAAEGLQLDGETRGALILQASSPLQFLLSTIHGTLHSPAVPCCFTPHEDLSPSVTFPNISAVPSQEI